MQDNHYRNYVFLEAVLNESDFESTRTWAEHQEMQFEYVKKQGLLPHHTLLDIGCGPLRLGAVAIPYLADGYYIGTDINDETIRLGRDMLAKSGIAERNATFIADEAFDMSAIADRTVDMAFSNSLFSHLTLNTIAICLTRLHEILAPGVVYHSTFFATEDGADITAPARRHKWGRDFETYPTKDPYHYRPSMLAAVASDCGFSFAIEPTFGHPTQTMGLFTRR